MKRTQAACLEQTIHFMLKEDIGHAQAVYIMKDEVARYKDQLANSRIQFKLVEESVQPDGSVIIKIKKQYNNYDCGDYIG